MSELKAVHAFDVYEAYTKTGDDDAAQVYLKSEADKVIAELKRQIEFLKVTTDSCKNCAQCADGMGKVFDKEFNPLKDKLRREKYKRCLAMAKWCRTSARCDEGLGAFKYRDWYWKWFKRWMKLAEQFKEAK